MSFKKMTAALAALCLTVSPVLAQGAAIPAPQSEEISGESSLAGSASYLGIFVGVAILAVAIYLLIDPDKEEPESP